MVQCLSAFMNCYYIVRRDAITTTDIATFQQYFTDFHRFRQIFITAGIRDNFSLPRQHALMHYPNAIERFGSPNGTCTSQTEAKHKTAVKQPWRWSNRNKPLPQMMLTITRLDKLVALRCVFMQQGMLVGNVADYMAREFSGNPPPIMPWNSTSLDLDDTLDSDGDSGDDVEPILGPRAKTNIWLASRHRMF